MSSTTLARPHSCRGGRPRRACPRGVLLVAASSYRTARTSSQRDGRLQRLPRIMFSYDRGQMNAEELADMLSLVACWAPGQSFHQPDQQLPTAAGTTAGQPFFAGSNSSTSSSSTSSRLGQLSSDGGPSSRRSSSSSIGAVDPGRLQGALRRSLVCVAAYAEERHLPPWLALASRGLAPPGQQGGLAQQQQQQAEPPGWPVPRRTSKVCVGFARAVGDSTLVATIHDVGVMPELQGLGLGRQLLERLTRQLDMLGIIDIGLLAPDATRGFFSACSFGKDTENSVVMTLGPGGIASRAGLPLEGMAVHLKRLPGRGALVLPAEAPEGWL